MGYPDRVIKVTGVVLVPLAKEMHATSSFIAICLLACIPDVTASQIGNKGEREVSFKPHEQQGPMVLPVFPLRKTVRLPTEVLTLNLYEERYLDMAGFILKQDNPRFFGAMYTSDKPQIVKQGSGPIVPILREGDIGVIFEVNDSLESMIPTIGMDDRRRIRLVGTGQSRFIVHRILHDGYGGEVGRDKTLALPFILVEAFMIRDSFPAEEDNGYLHLRQRLRHECTKVLASNVIGNEHADLLTNFETYLSRDQSNGYRSMATSGTSDFVGIEELLSFAIASVVLPDSDTRARSQALRLSLTSERIFQFVSSKYHAR